MKSDEKCYKFRGSRSFQIVRARNLWKGVPLAQNTLLHENQYFLNFVT